MPPLQLDGDDLGKKHQSYNYKVRDAIKNKVSFDKVVTESGDTDVDNLFKIDIASEYRNVEYILQVFKSEDMLYVSRAIKKSTWLITDDQYAHIINPQHLHSELFPYMTFKAISKLLLNIRLNLKQEARVDEFYIYYEQTDVHTALKWLPNCSMIVIEKAIVKHVNNLTPLLFKKLCERSFSVFEIFCKSYNNYKKPFFDVTTNFAKENPEKYLDLIEVSDGYVFSCPKLSKTHTAVLMKKCQERILNKFEKYSGCIDLEIFAKHLGPEKLKDFIFKLANNKELENWFTYNNIKPLVKYMPKIGKFQFLKNLFIDKSHDADIKNMSYANADRVLMNAISNPMSFQNIYQWYCYAPFETAFTDLKKLIKTESSPEERGAILRVILKTTGRNQNHIQTLLQYYHDKHINEPFKYKINFINAVLSTTNTHRYNKECWKILDEIFHSMEVYIESDNNVYNCVEAIIVNKILNNQPIPEILEKKFKFTTMRKLKNKLNKNEKDIIFNYLYNVNESKLNKQSFENLEGYQEALFCLQNMFNLLSDWDKDLLNYPVLLNKFTELIKFKNGKDWNVNFENLYNHKKSWRKYMFDQSLLISCSEEACINALKHDPALLQRHVVEVDAMRRKDKIVLRRLFEKLKIYWPQTLADEWANAYRSYLKQPEGHRALVRGLCAMLPRKELLDLFDKYAPKTPKIVWSEMDAILLSLRKNIARLMYCARPQPPPSSIFRYAQGDYLQYALPSLMAILYNISSHKSREILPEILNGPVSIQKHGIRTIFTKLKSDELKEIFSNIWHYTKNATIRAIIFQLTFELLCKEKNTTKIIEIWQLLEIFIQHLTARENKTIYVLLGNVDEVPISVRAEFCMKSYKFLKTLPTNSNYESLTDDIVMMTAKLMDTIDPNFVAEILLDMINNWFVNERILTELNGNPYYLTEVMIAYILCTTTEDEQHQRYENVIKPWMHVVLKSWNKIYENKKVYKEYFKRVMAVGIQAMTKQFSYKKYVIPINIFTDVRNTIASNLPEVENYDIITYSKLIVLYIECYDKVKSNLMDREESSADHASGHDQNSGEKYMRDVWTKISPLFAEECIRLLKEDIAKHFPSVQFLFARILQSFVYTVNTYDNYSFEKELLKYEDYVPACLVAIDILPSDSYDDALDNKLNEVLRIIYSHPSKEVLMHFYQKYDDYPIGF